MEEHKEYLLKYEGNNNCIIEKTENNNNVIKKEIDTDLYNNLNSQYDSAEFVIKSEVIDIKAELDDELDR